MTATEFAKRLGARRCGNSWVARCPAHLDRSPSLSIAEGNDGRVLVKCFAGCPTQAVLEALNLGWRDLFPSHTPRLEITHQQESRERAEEVALMVWDAMTATRRYFRAGLHRVERLQCLIGNQNAAAQTDGEREAAWSRLERLAPVATFFLAGFCLAFSDEPSVTVGFALCTPVERRQLLSRVMP